MDFLKNDETVEDLQYKNLKIIQSKEGFRFGMDAVLLADFVKIKKSERVLDLCTGSGIIPILLYGRKTAKKIYGIKIMPYVADLAKRSVELNGVEKSVEIIEADIKNATEFFNKPLDVISVNPPFEKANKDKMSENEYRAVAKHELLCDFCDICEVSEKLLKFGGRFYLVHRVTRLTEIIETMKRFNLQPKRIRFVYTKVNGKANLVLIEGLKNGKEGLSVEYPLFVRDEDGNYTKEIHRIYHRSEES